jgi:hypothetical protein
MRSLWTSTTEQTWRAALDAYSTVVAAQGVTRLPELDDWYRHELTGAIESRRRPHVTLAELTRLTEWKMARGVWRAPNLVLVRSNPPETVIATSTVAMGLVPHPTTPVATLATLKGVGPATASAVVSAVAPETYPFFDELVAAQVPGLGEVAWTLGYYRKYAEALRARAASLGKPWTPVLVEQALWSHVGGKKGVAQRRLSG